MPCQTCKSLGNRMCKPCEISFWEGVDIPPEKEKKRLGFVRTKDNYKNRMYKPITSKMRNVSRAR